MKDVFVPIDQAGRVVLPKNIRDDLAIKPGDMLKISVQGTAVTLSPSGETTGFFRKGKALVFSTVEDAHLSNDMVSSALESGRRSRDARSHKKQP